VIAARAEGQALALMAGETEVEVIIVDRQGGIVGRAPF